MFLWNRMKMVLLNWVLCSNFQRRSFSSRVEADFLSLRLPVQAPAAVLERMDPLGARSQFVDVQTLPMWPQQLAEGGEAPQPDPSDSQGFPSPFPFRPDINSRIILLWVFTPEMDDSASLVLKSTMSLFFFRNSWFFSSLNWIAGDWFCRCTMMIVNPLCSETHDHQHPFMKASLLK